MVKNEKLKNEELTKIADNIEDLRQQLRHSLGWICFWLFWIFITLSVISTKI